MSEPRKNPGADGSAHGVNDFHLFKPSSFTSGLRTSQGAVTKDEPELPDFMDRRPKSNADTSLRSDQVSSTLRVEVEQTTIDENTRVEPQSTPTDAFLSEAELELACLGACFVDNKFISQVEAVSNADEFSNPLHRRVAAALFDLHGKGKTVTPLTVAARMDSDADLAELGGFAYFADIAQFASDRWTEGANAADDIACLAALRDSSLPGDNAPPISIVPQSLDILPTFRASDFEGQPVAPREELVEDLIPAFNVTTLGGDGGTGKSLLELQLAVAMQTKSSFLGKIVNKNGPVLLISAEDDLKEIQRRLEAIAAVCGKLETRYRYSSTLGWNTFPVPMLTEKNKLDLTRCADDILLAREGHFPATIADLYDPDAMPVDLREAHEHNDEVLERIYIGRRFRNDTERLEKLFDLYTKKTTEQGPTKKRKAGAGA